MINNVGLLTNKPKRPRFPFLSVLFLTFFFFACFALYLAVTPRHGFVPSEIAVSGGRCKDQITCPGTVVFPMCRRSLTNDLTGEHLPTEEPCRISVEQQIDYDTKECAGDQCTFAECCMIMVVYAQQHSSSCGSASLVTAEIELGYHSNILSTMTSDLASAWTQFTGREQAINAVTSAAARQYETSHQAILDDFASVSLEDLQQDPNILSKAGIWGTWPKTLADQFEGRSVDFFMNAPDPVIDVFSSAFAEFGSQWIKKPLRDSIHELRDNQRLLALVRSPSGSQIDLHWIMIRPDGSAMDPAVCTTFGSLEAMAAFWVPVFEIHLRLTAPPKFTFSLPGEAGLRRSKASASLSDEGSESGGGSGSSHSSFRQRGSGSGSGMRRSKGSSSASLKDLVVESGSPFMRPEPVGPHTWHPPGPSNLLSESVEEEEQYPKSWPQTLLKTGSFNYPAPHSGVSFFQNPGLSMFGMRHSQSMGNLAAAASQEEDDFSPPINKYILYFHRAPFGQRSFSPPGGFSSASAGSSISPQLFSIPSTSGASSSGAGPSSSSMGPPPSPNIQNQPRQIPPLAAAPPFFQRQPPSLQLQGIPETVPDQELPSPVQPKKRDSEGSDQVAEQAPPKVRRRSRSQSPMEEYSWQYPPPPPPPSQIH